MFLRLLQLEPAIVSDCINSVDKTVSDKVIIVNIVKSVNILNIVVIAEMVVLVLLFNLQLGPRMCWRSLLWGGQLELASIPGSSLLLASHVGPPNASHVRVAGLPSRAAPPSPWRCWCCQPMEDRQGGVVCRGLIYNSKEQEGEPQHSRTESPSNRCLVRVPTLSPSWMDRNKDFLGRGYTPTYDHCCVRTSCIDTGVASQMEWCDTITLGWDELLCKHLL